MQVNPSRALSMAEIDEAFPGEWVAVEVTAEDDGGRTVAGRIIDHGRDRATVGDGEAAFRRLHPQVPTLLLFAGPVVDPDAKTVIVF